MADLTNVLKFFPIPSETYTNNLSASISSLAVTVPVNANNTYTDGDTVVLTVEPGTTNEATFTGEKASSPARFINCVWTEGNLGVGHSAGATVIDYDSATHVGMISKGIKKHANDDGTLKTTAVQAALNQTTAVPPDYTVLATAPTTIINNGQRSYSMTFPGVDYTDRLQAGTRLRTTRTVPAPIQSTSLNGTNQYWVKTAPNKMTFTDDFVVDAYVKLTSYPATTVGIVSRYNGTSGFNFSFNPDGTVQLVGVNGGSGNFSYVSTYQSLPLNKWVRITAQLDMSAFTATTTTSYIMIDGVDVPSKVSRAGTNPTALIQAGNLEVGSTSGGTGDLPGKVAQAAIFNAKVPQATMLGYHSQGYTGAEPNLVSAYAFNGTAVDLMTTTPNDLTAMNAAGYTADAPFGNSGKSSTLDYALVMADPVFSGGNTTAIVQVPEGCTIPTSGGVSAVSYSSVAVPYGFPKQKSKWKLFAINLTQQSSTPGSAIWANIGSLLLSVPIGSWVLSYASTVQATITANNDLFTTLSTTTTTETDKLLSASSLIQGTGQTAVGSAMTRTNDIQLSTQTNVYHLIKSVAGGTVYLRGENAAAVIYAENALL